MKPALPRPQAIPGAVGAAGAARGPDDRSKRRQGIARRIALLSWMITIVTLVVFVWVIIPEQKSTYVGTLESKARGVSASLQDIIAGAVVTEDYSTVVEHCKQVLQGDRSIHFLVVVKNDGFALVHELGTPAAAPGGSTTTEAQWRTDTLGEFWRPGQRVARSGIEVVPVFNRRLFRYARPFDYTGIEWGWIHVGLSLDAYDDSVRQVYQRTGLLAVFCLALSLGVSLLFTRRLVQPILELKRIVSRISSGDLSARAEIETGDEIQELAQSFNAMTDALQRRDQILDSVRFAAQQFLASTDWDTIIHLVLEKIGRAAGASRSQVCANEPAADGRLLVAQRHQWVAPLVPTGLAGPAAGPVAYQGSGFDEWEPRLGRGEIVTGTLSTASPALRPALQARGTQAFIVIPVMVEGTWWGYLGLEDHAREREWSDAERDSLRAAADMLGAAITRRRARDALLEAKAHLEQRVRERTAELQAEVTAKAAALTELAAAQSSLIEMSRKSGMAEVATGVLHNVGNVLNSVNVSCTMALNRLQKSSLGRVSQVAGLLTEANADLAHFLTADARGRQIPSYLVSLGRMLEGDRAYLTTEIESLRDKIEHIKAIVAMQQNYGRVSGVNEVVVPEVLIEDALKLSAGALSRRQITIERDYRPVPPISVDKHKVLQILLNLIANAGHALDAGPVDPRVMSLHLFESRPGFVAIQVRDNGVGITAENLRRIFQHGFTTRKDGHGFGLHSGALNAKSLGGSLVADSAGPGQGACFTLEVPAAKPAP
jgi:signal transduction histidine kinase